MIAPESVFEVTHEPQPGNRRQVAAAIKVYPLEPHPPRMGARALPARRDLPLGDDAIRAARAGRVPARRRRPPRPPEWEPADEFVAANPLGVVPIVPFENRATILGGGACELEDCIPLLRRIDKLTLDLLLTSDVAAFRQKWATGLDVPNDPETGKPVEPYKAAVDRLWVSEGPETKFGTFDASDLGQYLRAIEACVAALCAISRVPAHYLMQSNLANPPTAESLVSSESGLVAKVRERQRRFGEAWERADALASGLAGGVEAPAARGGMAGRRNAKPGPGRRRRRQAADARRAATRRLGVHRRHAATDRRVDARRRRRRASGARRTPALPPMAAPQDRRHRFVQERLSTALEAALMALLVRLPEPSTETAFATYERHATRLVGGAQRRSATFAMAYVAQLSPPSPVAEPPTTERALDGVAVTLASPVARSPVLRLLARLKDGDDELVARQAAGSYAGELGTGDLHAAERGGLDEAARAGTRRIVGWRKELSPRAVPVVRHDRLGRRSLPTGGYRTVPRTRSVRCRARFRRRIGGPQMAEQEKQGRRNRGRRARARARAKARASRASAAQGSRPCRASTPTTGPPSAGPARASTSATTPSMAASPP